MSVEVDAIFAAIEKREQEFVQVLRDAVAIKSVSSSTLLRPQVRRMGAWVRDWIMTEFPTSKVILQEIDGTQLTPEGIELVYPPLVLADIGTPSVQKKTLLIYAHYDVQPAEKSDGWDTEPFELVQLENGELRGRGSTDDKGPLIGWLCMLKCYKESGRDIPVNIKLCLEGMEESGSLGFDETARKVAGESDFFKGVDFCCISDNYWLSTQKPCLTYGLRGLTSCQISVSGPAADLHSGSFGGQVFQPMDDLIALLASLKDKDDNILIGGVDKDVMPVTSEEEALYTDIFFDIQEKKKEIGVSALRHEDSKMHCLMAVWRMPSLSIHGIEGAFSEPGFKTVIPRTVTGKFSIRTVPNMTGEQVEACITKHLETEMAKRNSPNTMKLHLHSGRWWYVEPTSRAFEAARRATETVHGVSPDFTREGGSIPITLTLTELTGREVCLLPMGRCNDGAHSQNEKLDLSNYLLGMKTFAAFLEELK